MHQQQLPPAAISRHHNDTGSAACWLATLLRRRLARSHATFVSVNRPVELAMIVEARRTKMHQQLSGAYSAGGRAFPCVYFYNVSSVKVVISISRMYML